MQENIPLHSAIEVFGAFTAIITAIVIILSQKKRLAASQSICVACGLLSMGILDMFHGAIAPGNTFIWLHSAASFFGGFLFMLAWLRSRNNQASFVTPVLSAAGAVLFGAISLAFPVALPLMINQGEFTITANLINIAAGLFFLIAAPRFFIDYRMGKGKDELLFFIICILLGLAEVLFQYSRIWDSTWWLWHYLRLAGLSIIMIYTFKWRKRPVWRPCRAAILQNRQWHQWAASGTG